MKPSQIFHALILCSLVFINSCQATVGISQEKNDRVILGIVSAILWFIVLEINYHPIYNLITLTIDTYHHRQSVQSRRLRYSLFRQKVKSEPVEFESEARKVVK